MSISLLIEKIFPNRENKTCYKIIFYLILHLLLFYVISIILLFIIHISPIITFLSYLKFNKNELNQKKIIIMILLFILLPIQFFDIYILAIPYYIYLITHIGRFLIISLYIISIISFLFNICYFYPSYERNLDNFLIGESDFEEAGESLIEENNNHHHHHHHHRVPEYLTHHYDYEIPSNSSQTFTRCNIPSDVSNAYKEIIKMNSKINIDNRISTNIYISNTSQQLHCVVCQKPPLSYALSPCGHFCLCENCKLCFVLQQQVFCPLCISPIGGFLRIYDSEGDNCIICLSKKISYAIIPCGHYCLCEDCKIECENEQEEICPVCRTIIQGFLKIYT